MFSKTLIVHCVFSPPTIMTHYIELVGYIKDGFFKLVKFYMWNVKQNFMEWTKTHSTIVMVTKWLQISKLKWLKHAGVILNLYHVKLFSKTYQNLCLLYAIFPTFFSRNKSPWKIMKNAFYFILKAFSVAKVFKFLYFLLPLFSPCQPLLEKRIEDNS